MNKLEFTPKEGFIEWPSYGVCPKCKKKVHRPGGEPEKITETDLTPMLKRVRKKESYVVKYSCPNCGAEMKHIITSQSTIVH
jgi:DNA-directed RNA polymerase subunit RPC12/RpoP